MSMTEHFLRQRRNVFITGITLLVVTFYSGDNSVGISAALINGISIPSSILTISIFLIFCYFCLRYFQYLSDEEILSSLYEIYLMKYRFDPGRLSNNGDYSLTRDDTHIRYKSGQYTFKICCHGNKFKRGEYGKIDFDKKKLEIIEWFKNSEKGITQKTTTSEIDVITKQLKMLYKKIYKHTSIKNIFFKDIKTFTDAIMNRKYGDYIFPVIYIVVVFLLVLLHFLKNHI